MTKKTIFMRAADALLLPNPPITKEQFQKWVKESGLKEARNKKVPVEVEVT
jgi:uncharacterized protein YneF (UPF0154 family)